jgi:hypothetical protein
MISHLIRNITLNVIVWTFLELLTVCTAKNQYHGQAQIYHPFPDTYIADTLIVSFICHSFPSLILPNAIQLLKQNPDKIAWFSLPMNPNAIELLENYKDHIQWSLLSYNPSIFKKNIDYKFLDKKMAMIKEELIMKCMHPKRLKKFLQMGGQIGDF